VNVALFSEESLKAVVFFAALRSDFQFKNLAHNGGNLLLINKWKYRGKLYHSRNNINLNKN
jgi:hypothetical protein